MKQEFSYHMPVQIVFGDKFFNEIDRYINGRKALLITSEGFVKRGLVSKIKLLTNSIVHVVSDIKSHPEFKDLNLAYKSIMDIHFDVIVAVGGGSVLDAAKYFSVQGEKLGCFVEDIVKGRKKESLITKFIPIISMPTTSGTGSEITPWATIWDMEEQKKYSLHFKSLFSETAIYAPFLTTTVPKQITIQTGLDALSHALESIWNKNASEITVSYAIKSAKLIAENLVYLTNNLDCLETRENVMKACMYSGLAFSNTQTAIAHSMSYFITAKKGIDHGIACSFTLPLLIDKVVGNYGFVDNALIEIFGSTSSQPLRKILKELGVSTEFADYGIDEQAMKELLESLVFNQRTQNSLISM